MYDLIKNVTASHNVSDSRRPTGWSEYLQSLALLNVPFSVVPNLQVRRKIEEFKTEKPATPATHSFISLS